MTGRDREKLNAAALDVAEGIWSAEDAAADLAITLGRALTTQDQRRLREAIAFEQGDTAMWSLSAMATSEALA